MILEIINTIKQSDAELNSINIALDELTSDLSYVDTVVKINSKPNLEEFMETLPCQEQDILNTIITSRDDGAVEDALERLSSDYTFLEKLILFIKDIDLEKFRVAYCDGD